MDGDVIDISIIKNIGNIHKLTVDMIKPFLSEDTEVQIIISKLLIESNACNPKSINNRSKETNAS